MIERFVRRGPLASVYTARTRTGTDAFMLRVVHSDLVTWTERAQGVFTREIERVKSLKHPCIPKIVAYDCSQGGPMLLTVHTGAPSLREIITRHQRPTPAQLARVLHAIGAALSAMHHHSTPFNHRAVAPENIMIGDRGQWIEEAGLVHAVVASELVQDRPSYFSFPGYQTPEDFHRLGDSRADAFGLALVAFEALTGHGAFEMLGPAALSALIQVGQLPRATEFCPELPSAIDAVFERAWSLREHDGYVDPTSFAQDFSNVIESLGVHSNRILVPSGLVPSSMPPPLADAPPLEDMSSPGLHMPVIAPLSGPQERSARPTLRMGSASPVAGDSPLRISASPVAPRVVPSDEPTPVVLNPLIPAAAYGPAAAERSSPEPDFPAPPSRSHSHVHAHGHVHAPPPTHPHGQGARTIPAPAAPPAAHPVDPAPIFGARAASFEHPDPLISLPSLDGPPSSPGFEYSELSPPAHRVASEVSSPEIDPSLLESVVPDEPVPPPPAVRSAPPPLPRSDRPAVPEAVRSQPAPRTPSPISHPPADPPLPPPIWRPSDATILAASRVLSFSTVVAAIVATIGLVQASRTLDAVSSTLDSVPLASSAASPAPPLVAPSSPEQPPLAPPSPPPTTPAVAPEAPLVAAPVTDAATPAAPTLTDAGVAVAHDAMTAPRVPAPTVLAPVAPTPDQLPSDAARRAVTARLRPLVSDCVEGLDPGSFPVRVRYAGPTGTVSFVRLRGIYAEAPIGPCIEEAIRSVRMPSFPAPTWEYVYMFTVPTPR